MRSKILYDFSVLIIDCMMEFVNYCVVKIIRCKIFFIQIFCFSESCHRSKNNRFIRTFLMSCKESIVLRISYISEGICCLFQDFLSVCNKQNFAICFRIKRCQDCFPNACCSANECFLCTFCSCVFQCTERFNLCSSWFKQWFDFIFCILFKVISVKIFCNCRTMPVL